MKNLEQIKENGYCILKAFDFDNTFKKNVIDQASDHLINKIKVLQNKQLNFKSTVDISDLIPTEYKKKFIEFSEIIIKETNLNKYILFPKVLDFTCRIANFDKNIKQATDAMLWHRDQDDYFSQVKIFFPLTEVDDSSGMLSVANKKICDSQTILLDKDLYLQKNLPNNDFLRIKDSTLRNLFSKDLFFDWKAKVGEVMLCDTNNCYHKGGYVLTPDKFRIMIQITVGNRFTHMFVYNKSKLGIFFWRVMFRLFNFIFGKQRHLKKII